jgi:CBS domain containing-hemolysin-like protein
MLSTLVFILFCMLCVAFFAGIETGVISIPRMRIRHLSEEGDERAQILESFLEHPDRLLGTSLTGVNLCTVAASVMAASLGHTLLGQWGELIMGTTVTLVVLVFCEYLPKAWFQSEPTKRCRQFAYLLRWTSILLRPLASTLTWVTQALLPSSIKDQPPRHLFATKDEIDILAQESEAHGMLSPRQRIMIRRVLDLSAKTARDIMRPIATTTTARADATVEEFCALVRQGGHARLPVFDGSRNAYIGTANFFDVMSDSRDGNPARLATFVRPPLFIPEGTALVEVFTRLRVSRQPMCLVVNAQTQVTGVITTQDVLGQIVGTL